MKPGDLRRFSATVGGFAMGVPLGGKTFMVVEMRVDRPGWDGSVNILVDGMVVGPWGYPWVEQNSEVISEERNHAAER